MITEQNFLTLIHMSGNLSRSMRENYDTHGVDEVGSLLINLIVTTYAMDSTINLLGPRTATPTFQGSNKASTF
jgi:hypothetical protein